MPMELADHRAGLGIERREEIAGAVTDIIGSAALGRAGTHRQRRLAAIERLYLRFLIHTQHQRFVRRIEIKADNVADFFDEQRVFGYVTN